MSGKTRLYKLKHGKKPVTWELRKRALISDEKKGLREIIYIRGGHSIYKDQYDKDANLQAADVIFEDGAMLVNPKDVLLVTYLEQHPEFNVSFELDDPQAAAEAKLAKRRLKNQVESELEKLESFDALVEALTKKGESTLHFTPAQKELRCYEEADKDPEKVLKAIADPKNAVRYMVAVALQKGIIRESLDKSKLVWGDDEETIMTIPFGQKASESLAAVLFEPKGEGTLAELQKRVEAIGLAPKTKKKTASKK